MTNLIEWWEVQSMHHNTPELEEMIDEGIPSPIIEACDEALNARICKFKAARLLAQTTGKL